VRTWAAVPGLVTLVPVYWFLGAMFATIDLSTVGFSAEHGHLALAGLVLGAYALGSAIGGLWYGTRHWRAPLERRFAITLACTVAGVATFWLQPGLASLVAVIIVAGMSISPTLIAGYGLIERQAPPERRTEGMTWLSSAISVGVATGSPLAGHLIDAYGARWGYLLAAACGLGAVLIAVAGLGRLRRADGPADPAEAEAAVPAEARPAVPAEARPAVPAEARPAVPAEAKPAVPAGPATRPRRRGLR
jgi:MFS family permease